MTRISLWLVAYLLREHQPDAANLDAFTRIGVQDAHEFDAQFHCIRPLLVFSVRSEVIASAMPETACFH
jgi:hypothetical protein